MTRTTTVSGIRPDKAGDGEWSTSTATSAGSCPRSWQTAGPFSIDAAPGGMTIVTPLPPPAAGPDEGRITSRKTLYERFKTRLNENLDERKQ